MYVVDEQDDQVYSYNIPDPSRRGSARSASVLWNSAGSAPLGLAYPVEAVGWGGLVLVGEPLPHPTKNGSTR